MNATRLTLPLLLLATLAACAQPHVFGLRHDPAFTYDSLHSGNVAVGGVTTITSDDPPTPATRSQFESLLATALMEAYPRLKVMPAGAVAAALGEASHTELLARYRLAGDLDSAAQHELNTRLENARYVVLARIEADLTDNSESVTPDTARKPKYETVKLAASRTMTVGFDVYDRSLGRSVWRGRLSAADTAANTYVEQRGFVAAVVTSMLRGEHKYPNPPSRTKVLRPLFEEFAESLPRPPKKPRR
jgi:hypothetical protein